MSWVGYGIMVFGFIRLVVSFVNYITKPSLPLSTTSHVGLPEISVLIPARNEEANIGNLLKDLSSSKKEILEIIIYDDNSTDDTYHIVQKWLPVNPKIKLLKGLPLPKGWMGKNYACYQLAKEAKGKYILFIDADVRISNQAIIKAMNYLHNKKLKLLSIFPEQLMPDYGTTLAVPLMNWILLSLLPLIAVEKTSESSLCAANGQFMFFESKKYKELQPHKKFHKSAIEDMKIMNFYKRNQLKVAVLLGNKDIKCTMYRNLEEALEGFSKNFFQFLGGSQLVCFLFAIITTIGPLIILIFNGITATLVYIAVILLIRILVSLTSRQSVKMNILRMLPQQFTLWKIILNASQKKNKKNLLWKGRNIYSDI